RILLVDRELRIVKSARNAVRPRVENGNRRKCRGRDARIHGSNAASIVTPEKAYAQIHPACGLDLRAHIKFVREGPCEGGRDRRIRPAETQHQSTQLARLEKSVGIAINPLIFPSAEAIEIAEI